MLGNRTVAYLLQTARICSIATYYRLCTCTEPVLSCSSFCNFLVGVSTHDCMHGCHNVLLIGSEQLHALSYVMEFIVRQYILLVLVSIVIHKY